MKNNFLYRDCLVHRRIRAEFKPNKSQKENRRLAKLRNRDAAKETNFRVAAVDNGVDVFIYDVIGWPYIEAQDLLYRIPSGAKNINVHINSPGGDVIEGMAIYNMLSGHKADVTIHIDGLAASSASLIAMAGDTIQMAKASFLMIHNPWSMMSGDADDLRKEADILDKMSDVFAQAYCDRCGKDKEAILEMMKAETWFNPTEAIESGFADEITGEVDGVDVSASFDLSIFNNTPELIRQGSSASRQAQATINNSVKEESMNEKLRALLERMGLSKDATEKQAWEYLAGLDLETVGVPEEKEILIQALSAKTAPAQPGNTGLTQADLDAAVQKAAADERQRASSIREDVRVAGFEDSFAQELIDNGSSLNAARQAIMAKMKTTNPPMGSGRISMGETDGEKFRAAAVDGLSFRCNFRAEKPAAGHEVFKAASIEFIARQCLERMGVNHYAFTTRDQVAREILKRSAQGGGFSSDDFTSIFLDVSNKSLLKAYTEAPATWRPFVNVVSESDFKSIYGVSLSEAPDLDLIGEHGEYKEGKMSDNQESYSIGSYGKMVYLSRIMIVNDSLRAFTRLPQLLGSSARRKESDLVWAKITSNPTMNDSTALFHADHSNLASSGGAISSTTLSAGRKAMRMQTGLEGNARLDLRPAFLAHPVGLETSVEILLRSAALPEDNKSGGVHNPWQGKLTPVSDPRLDDNSATAWYLIGDPNQIDTIEVAYLDGNEEPYTEEQALFERDAVGFKVRHDVGVGVMDHRGFYKNAGA